MTTSTEKLHLSLKKHGVELSKDEWRKLTIFLNEVRKWARRTTIVSKRIGDDELMGLLFDSLILKTEIHGHEVADLGSGGGFPGIPLSVTLPDKHFTLVEITRKKCIFLEYVSALLGLSNVTVKCVSWEYLEGKFDTVVSMGTGFKKVLTVAKQILSPDGFFIYVSSKGEKCNKRIKNPFLSTTTCIIVSRETIGR